MSIRTNKSNTLLSNIGSGIFVGAPFLLLSFLVVKFFAPDCFSSAKNNSASTEAGPYTMSISTDDAVPIDVTATSSQQIYTGISSISYTNTCQHGFYVTISSSSDETDLVRSGKDDLVKRIPSSVSSGILLNNTWGYSIDGGSTYERIPTINAPSMIINTNSANADAITFNLVYGIKTDNNLPSGVYLNDIVYTVSAKQECFSYNVVWDYGSGAAASGVTYPSDIGMGETVDISQLTPTRRGYTFVGWSNGVDTYTSADGVIDINPNGVSPVIMTAQWTPTPYAISYSLGGGTVSGNPTSYTIESDSFTLNNPTRDGYGFTGWSGTDITNTSTSVSIPKGSIGARSYTANWSPNLTGISQMQQMTTDICDASSVGMSNTLVDTRDNNRYLVKKLKDGKCWMTQNLRISNKTISSSDSNLPTGSTWTVPASSTSGFSSYNTNNAYIDSTYGGYYTFYTATAGWGTNSSTSGDSPRDICPKGWRMPTGNFDTGNGDYWNLHSYYSSSTSLQGDPGFVLSGYIDNGTIQYQGSRGHYWASSVLNDGTRARAVVVYKSSLSNMAKEKYFGFAVRCLSR